VVVAVVAVRVMEVTSHEIVDMVAVGHGLVAATRPVNVTLVVSGALMMGCAAIGVGCRYFDYVFIDVTFVHVMQMPIVQVVDVAGVLDRGVPAIGPMNMGMVFVLGCQRADPPKMWGRTRSGSLQWRWAPTDACAEMPARSLPWGRPTSMASMGPWSSLR